MIKPIFALAASRQDDLAYSKVTCCHITPLRHMKDCSVLIIYVRRGLLWDLLVAKEVRVEVEGRMGVR